MPCPGAPWEGLHSLPEGPWKLQLFRADEASVPFLQVGWDAGCNPGSNPRKTSSCRLLETSFLFSVHSFVSRQKNSTKERHRSTPEMQRRMPLHSSSIVCAGIPNPLRMTLLTCTRARLLIVLVFIYVHTCMYD